MCYNLNPAKFNFTDKKLEIDKNINHCAPNCEVMNSFYFLEYFSKFLQWNKINFIRGKQEIDVIHYKGLCHKDFFSYMPT